MDGARLKTLAVALACLLGCCARSEGLPGGNAVSDVDFPAGTSGDDYLKPGFRDDPSTGPEKLATEVLEADERERGELPGPTVDEETISKAEKMADKDLLSGLNRILRNNETLTDVFRAESVYEIP